MKGEMADQVDRNQVQNIAFIVPDHAGLVSKEGLYRLLTANHSAFYP
jgi:hypothetical protein